jgi:hypothetical protein
MIKGKNASLPSSFSTWRAAEKLQKFQYLIMRLKFTLFHLHVIINFIKDFIKYTNIPP